MSRENIESLRGAYEAFNRGEWDRALTAFAPDAEWHEPDLPDAAVYRGVADIRAYWEMLARTLPGFRSQPQQFFDAGERVVVASLVSGTGGGSQPAVDGVVGMVWTFHAGKVVRCVVRRELDDALLAVGLLD
jgi:ketosteroid isomerase-like protein